MPEEEKLLHMGNNASHSDLDLINKINSKNNSRFIYSKATTCMEYGNVTKLMDDLLSECIMLYKVTVKSLGTSPCQGIRLFRVATCG